MFRLRLFLVRHGQVASNRDYRYVGARDEPLTELGRRQAKSLALGLSDLRIDEVLASPLRRARETADRIADAIGLEARLEERLREQSFGEWEGMSRREVMERSPADLERLAAWEADPGVAPPGGESLLSVQARVGDLIEELDGGLDPGASRSVALVSHVGPIKAALALALDVSVVKARRIFLDPGTVSVVDWGDPPLVRLCNGHGHAGWSEARWMKDSLRQRTSTEPATRS